MSVENTIAHLKHVAEQEGIQYEEEALAVIAEKADGGMRDALSIFDQAVSFCQGTITYQKVIEDLNVLDADNYFRIVDLALENKVADIMVLLNQIIGRGFDGGHLINGLAAHVRNVLMAKDAQTLPLLEVSRQQRERYQQQAQKAPTPFLYKALKIMNQCDQGYRQSSNKRLLVELTLIQVAQLTQPDDADASAGRSPKRLKSLFRKLLNNAQQPKASQQGAAVERRPAERPAPKADAPAIPVTSHQRPSAPVSADRAASTAADEAPAATPVASAFSPSAAPKLKLDELGITFQRLRQGERQKAAEADVEITNKEEKSAFTEETLLNAWIAMCNRMPQKMVAMAQRMKNMRPSLIGDDCIEVVVDNDLLLTQMQDIKGRIRATLAKDLHNGQIQISLRKAEAEEVKPILSKREIFDDIRKSNPAVEKLRTLLDLQLT
jgi:DNA polymerase-3 subunit gamma/tau